MVNKHGLPRNIGDPVKREIRKRSKFGCVVCRAGIYEYEHIDPEYCDAATHDPDDICCLCTGCHAKVTRGHYSKAFIRKMYAKIQAADPSDVRAPFDHLDFHEGKAELKIGGISYDPGVTSVLKYHGTELFSISPSSELDSAGINAVFQDDNDNETLRIVNNAWHGAVSAWDTEVVGPRIRVRKKKGVFALVLRLEPPGRIVIEKLDMRFADAHILASEQSHVVGRYHDDSRMNWFYANMVHMGGPLDGASAIEFLTPLETEWRDQNWNGRGQRLAFEDNTIVMQTGLGVANKRMGIIIGANCLKFGIGKFACGGPLEVNKIRQQMFKKPGRIAAKIGLHS